MKFPESRVFWSVSLGHMTNDVFMAMGPVILASIAGVYFELPAALIGVAISARQMTGAVSQPLFGWLSDRGGSRVLGAGGVAWTVTVLGLGLLAAMAGIRWLMIVLFAASALGSGAFHPVGTAHASYRARETANSQTAWFFLFGQVGLALGPALAGILWGLTLGVDGSGGSLVPFLLLSLAAIPPVIFMALSIPRYEPSGEDEQAAAEEAAAKRPQWRPLSMLGLLVFLRGVAYPGSVAFIPVLFRDKGWSPEAYGVITSVFWISSAISGVIIGGLADRVDRRYVVTGTLLVATPLYFLLPVTDGVLAFVMVLATGAFIGGIHSIIVVLAQSLIPGRKGFASGVALGFIFGVGSLGTLLLGYAADGVMIGGVMVGGFGLERTFQGISVFVLLAALVGITLPATPRKVKRVEAAPAAQGTD